MVSASDYVDGVRIRWRRLATLIFGAGILAYFEGVVAFILSLFDIPIGLAGGFANWAGNVINTFFAVDVMRSWRAWTAAIPFVRESGIAGFVAALAIVLLTFGVVAWVVSRVR